MADLTEIKGIGEKTAEQLRAAGIEDADDLARVAVEALVEQGFALKTAKGWQEAAVELTVEDVGAPTAQSATELGSTEESEASEHWTVGSWKEFDRYQCNYCAFDTLDKEVIQEHYQGVHAPPPPPRFAGTVVVADRFGNPVEEKEVV